MPKARRPWQITFCKIGRNCQTSQIREYANASNMQQQQQQKQQQHQIERQEVGMACKIERATDSLEMCDSCEMLSNCNTSDSKAMNRSEKANYSTDFLTMLMNLGNILIEYG